MTAVGTAIVSVAIVGLIGVGAAEATFRFLRRRSKKPPPPRLRLRFYPAMGLGLIIAGVCAWAFASHHAGIGVAVLIAFLIVPEMIILPIRVRRSRRAAESARAQRSSPKP